MTGLGRVRIKSLRHIGDYYKASYNREDSKLNINSLPESVKQFQTQARQFIVSVKDKLSPSISRQLFKTIRSTPPELYPDLLASFLDLDFADSLSILRATELEERFQVFIDIYRKKSLQLEREVGRSEKNSSLVMFRKFRDDDDKMVRHQLIYIPTFFHIFSCLEKCKTTTIYMYLHH